MNQTRWWLLPLAWIYSAIVWLRNMLFDVGVLSSDPTSSKTIVVGNLSLGGSGKTPHADYIIKLLNPESVALLSRGYGRTGKDFKVVYPNSAAIDTGDEPLLLAKRNPAVLVAVDADRLRGIETLKAKNPERSTIVLDDAMQHRKLKGGLNILLTTWQRPFTVDYCIPAGKLRDHKMRARQAHAIVVTKTPLEASIEERKRMAGEFESFNIPIYFSGLKQGGLVQFCGAARDKPEEIPNIILLSAIADATLFEQEAQKVFKVVKHFAYRDHHRFTGADLQRIRNFIGRFAAGKAALVTTEKDAMRLLPIVSDPKMNSIPMYYREINVDFGIDTEAFNTLIRTYAQS